MRQVALSKMLVVNALIIMANLFGGNVLGFRDDSALAILAGIFAGGLAWVEEQDRSVD